jgi:ActR/RegA family two-component response regulator
VAARYPAAFGSPCLHARAFGHGAWRAGASCLDEVANVASHLLLIDDDLRLTEMVGGYLRQNGFEVSTAPTLASGRELLRQASFDALLLDLMLPDGDGLDFTRELRGEPRTRRCRC